MMDLKYSHIFFPQLLYNIKLINDYSIGGSIINVKNENINLISSLNKGWFSFDISFFIPLKYFSKYKRIDNVKLGIGVFRTGLININTKTTNMPTYSIDIKFKKFN